MHVAALAREKNARHQSAAWTRPSDVLGGINDLVRGIRLAASGRECTNSRLELRTLRRTWAQEIHNPMLRGKAGGALPQLRRHTFARSPSNYLGSGVLACARRLQPAS